MISCRTPKTTVAAVFLATGEEHLLGDKDQRVRDVRQGPDGSLFVVTDEDKGELWKMAPRR